MARTKSAVVEALERVPLLAGLTKKDRGRLASSMKAATYPVGTDILVEGRAGVGFFVIASGSATVSIGGEAIRTLGPGDHFGELALIDGGTRSATVTAASDLEVLSMSSWTFKRFVEKHPSVAWALLSAMADRLRERA